MTTTRIGFIAIAIMGILAAPALAQTGHDLFQQALVKEQAEGDLRSAIDLYERIARDFASDAALAAKALVQMGQCYERLGSQEAQNAYRQVLEKYPNEVESAGQARARLAALSRPAPTSETSTIQIRRLMGGRYPEIGISGSPTPDGRSLVGGVWDTEGLGILDLDTGESRLFHQRESITGYGENPTVSPDGRWVAYDWHLTGAGVQSDQSLNTELWVVGIDGSSPRMLRREPAVYVECWSPDSRQIAVINFPRESTDTEIARISLADGTKTTLWRFEYPARFFAQLAHSPDDRFVAVGYPVEEDSGRFDIGLLATDGSGLIPLIDHPDDDWLVGWVPGTDQILFTSDRSGSRDLWAISVGEDGSPGQPRPVKREVGDMIPMGFTADGSLFYAIYTLQYNIAVAPFDEVTGVVGVGNSEALGGLGSNMRPSWSPDGNHLVFVRRRPSPPGRGFGMTGYEEVVYVRDMRTGEERALAEDIAPATAGAPRWFPDGRRVLVLGMPQDRSASPKHGEFPPAAYEVSPVTGQATALFQLPPNRGWWYQIGIRPTSDGQGVVYKYLGKLVLHRLFDHQEFTLFPDANLDYGDIAVSPEGSPFVFGVNLSTGSGGEIEAGQPDGRRFMILPPAGGEAREFFRWEGSTRIANLGWTSDGGHFLFAVSEESGTSVFRIPRGGREPEPLWSTPLHLRGLSPSPDKTRISYFTQENEGEILVMDNLVAALREAEGGR